MASQVAVQAQAVTLSEKDVYKMAASVGRIRRKHLHLHVRTDSSTLWNLLDKALQVKHPCTMAHRSTVRTQLRLMNGLRSDSAAWAVHRWFQWAASSVEDRLAKPLEEIREEVVDVTVDLRRGGPTETLSLPWAEWTHQPPGAQVMVYTDASRRETELGVGTGAGLVVQMDDTSWGVAVPLPPELDDTTAELLALAVGRWIARCLRDLRAQAGEVVYEAQAAESLVEGCLYRQ